MGTGSKGHNIAGANPLLRYARSSNGAISIVALALLCAGFGAGFMVAKNNPGGTAEANAAAVAALRRKTQEVASEEVAWAVEDSAQVINHAAVEEFMASLNKDRLLRIADNHRATYANGKPFPHLAFDDVFPLSMVREVEKEVPEDQVGEDGCYKGVPKNKCYKHERSFKKSGIAQDDLMGPHTRIFMVSCAARDKILVACLLLSLLSAKYILHSIKTTGYAQEC